MNNEKVKILWSGITGRTGQAALKGLENIPNVDIVAGICRNDKNYYNYEELDKITEDFDIIVDFSHKDSFDKILDYAIRKKKPIIIGTAGLSDEQLASFQEAAKIIPVFRGGNFRFEVKKFIDEVVAYAKSCNDTNLELIETHYKTKKIPSETAKSFLKYDELINDWKVNNLHCRVIGFKELGEDVLKIALLMKNKKAGSVYDLDRLIKEEKA